jgi:hypothetical protein
LSPKEDYWKWRKDGYRELKKDYLLLVNGYKIRIPKPKACRFGIPSGIEDMFKANVYAVVIQGKSLWGLYAPCLFLHESVPSFSFD